MIKILFAPLQGYTTSIYRKAHAEIFGGVDAYYAPFLRIENGLPREKDLRDLENASCTIFKVVPQIIANSASEFRMLAEAILQKGFTEIDFNMGCPFPMQVNRHRGAGLLSDVQAVQEIMTEIKKMSVSATAGATRTAPKDLKGTAPVKFSVKMRLGQETPDEAFALLPILNDAPLAHITLHPRLGKQQYKGAIDFNSFERFYNECRLPLVYNGDITTVAQINELEHKYPKLIGVMIGRGLLARPSLAAEYKATSNNDAAPVNADATNDTVTPQNLLDKILQMHQAIFDNACKTYQGDSQILSHTQTFWDYLEPNIPKKIFKKIKKAGNIGEYMEAVALLKA